MLALSCAVSMLSILHRERIDRRALRQETTPRKSDAEKHIHTLGLNSHTCTQTDSQVAADRSMVVSRMIIIADAANARARRRSCSPHNRTIIPTRIRLAFAKRASEPRMFAMPSTERNCAHKRACEFALLCSASAAIRSSVRSFVRHR